MRNLVLFAATGAGSGYCPWAPGTAGTAVGLGLYGLLCLLPGPLAWSLPAAFAAVAALGCWAAGQAEDVFGGHDDSRITIDEVAGMLAALLFLPARLDVALAGFVLFRVFDIAKPAFVRRAEALPRGFGVMADDILAGLCANAVGQLIWRVAFAGGIR
jgi:phosphatidylglycerophosphatase A